MITFESQGRACSRSRLLALLCSFASHVCRRFSIILYLSLFLSACSLAGDVTPPPGTNTINSSGPAATGLPATADAAAEQPTSATSAFYPGAMPAAQEGGLLYVQHCAP